MDIFIEELRKYTTSLLEKGEQLYLYGSRARGTEKENSDWDLLIITKQKYNEQEAFEKYVYPIVLFGQINGQEISVITYSKRQWDKEAPTLFHYNVMKERIKIV